VTRTLLALAWGVALLGSAAAASAATVVLVKGARPSPLASEAAVRLRGELAAEGFSVRVVEVPEGADLRAALAEAASAPDVDAVLALLSESPGDAIELRVVDRVTGKTVIRSVPVEPESSRSAEVLSIRALELLRASFLEIALGASRAPPVAAPPPPPPPEVARMTRVALERGLAKTWAVEVGGCLLRSFEGIPLSMAPVVRLERALGDRLLARMTVAGLGTRARVDGFAGSGTSASVAQDFGLVELGVKLRPSRALRPFFSVGAGALHVTSEGQTAPPYRAATVDLWSLAADAGAGARLAVSGRFELALEIHAQLAEPYPTIRIEKEPVARSGRPTMIASLTLLAWL
jgi:hypothetical protein